jgi:hypothetical protein
LAEEYFYALLVDQASAGYSGHEKRIITECIILLKRNIMTGRHVVGLVCEGISVLPSCGIDTG